MKLLYYRTAKEVTLIVTSLLHLVSTGTIAADNFLVGLKETFEFAPDLYIDIPMLYDYLGKITVPQIEKKVNNMVYIYFSDICFFTDI